MLSPRRHRLSWRRSRCRRIDGNDALQDVFARPMSLARRVRDQDRRQRGKVYSLHAPEVECIGKGKASASGEDRGDGGR
jgi:IS5 family transposase